MFLTRLSALAIVLFLALVHSHEVPDEHDENFAQNLNVAIDKAEAGVKEEDETDVKAMEEGIDTPTNDQTSTDLLALFASPEVESKKLAKIARVQLKALSELVHINQIDPHTLKVNKKYLKIWKSKFQKYCANTYKGPKCDPDDQYRTADGFCNNLDNPTWGGIFCPQLREIPPMYDDGVDSPRKRNSNSSTLPSPRVVSNFVHSVNGKSPRNEDLTVMVMQWGQFIDHEFVATPVLKGENGSNIQCCGNEAINRSQCFPIRIPDNDPYFKKTCMNFVRSAPVPNHECDPGFREQMNQVTSYIDGSTVYGSKLADTMDLRAKTGGLLRTVDEGDNMMPKNLPKKCVLETPKDYCLKAGDGRVNVVPSLAWSHMTMFREHNRIATILAKINPHWSDEMIFQQTRRIIGAMIQHINYNEYLPAIFNKDTISKYKLSLKKGFSGCYNPKVNPTIANVFAVAAFRFGHSQIPDYQATMTKNYKFDEKTPIQMTYHRPHMIVADHGKALDGIARWLSADPTPLADGKFELGTRNLLFKDSKNDSLDLVALNIQRGRDHGIPGYNHWRVHCKLVKANMSGSEFNLPDHTEEDTHNLEHAYKHVDDIDLFAGAMTEKLLPDSSVGPTFACLLGRQFRRLKKGDRFWYETPKKNIRFKLKQLKEIKKCSLARIMCDNYDIDSIQPNVMHAPGPGNERMKCSDIPGIDLSMWKSLKTVNNRPIFCKNSKCGEKKQG